MRILIDTHILIWHLNDDPLLSLNRSKIITEHSNSVYVSVASLWEITIKQSLGRLKTKRTIEDISKTVSGSTVSLVPIEINHLTALSALPHHHKDPFDRLIIAQAIAEGWSIMSVDEHFEDYGVTVI